MGSILVTGSEGFLGRHLVRRLVALGHAVHGLDRGSVSPPIENYKLHQVDVLDADGVREFAAAEKPDGIVHLAALTTHEEMVKDRSATLKINMQGTINLLDAYVHSGARRFVYASTGKVYGKIDRLPIREDHPLHPLNVLGKTKIVAEKLIDFYADEGAGQVVVLRIFNVYGPEQRPSFLVPTILSQVVTGADRITLGSINDRRDYVYIDDVIDALVQALEVPVAGKSDVFNVGTGVAHSAADVVRTIGEILSRQITISVDSSRLRRDEYPEEYADVSRLEAFGWRPAHSLRRGLEKTVTHYLRASCKQ